jgi:hypothetical protein
MINELHRTIAVFVHVMMVSTFAFAVALGVSGATSVSPNACATCIATIVTKPNVTQPVVPKTTLLKVRSS